MRYEVRIFIGPDRRDDRVYQSDNFVRARRACRDDVAGVRGSCGHVVNRQTGRVVYACETNPSGKVVPAS